MIPDSMGGAGNAQMKQVFDGWMKKPFVDLKMVKGGGT
jgi:hypothetical protein